MWNVLLKSDKIDNSHIKISFEIGKNHIIML